MSQVAYQSNQSAHADNASSTNSLTLNISKPVSLAVGDLMIAHINAYTSIASLQLPAGWTLIHSIIVQSTLNDMKAWKTADASDVAASTFAFACTSGGGTGQILMEGAIYRYINAHPTAPINAQSNANANTPGVTTLTTGAITPTESSLLLLLLSWNRAGGTTVSGYAVATTNPTWTERIDDNNTAFSSNAGIAMADGSRSALTSTGTGSAVVAATIGNYSLTLISISPAPVRPATFLAATFGFLPVVKPNLPVLFNAATFGFLPVTVDIIANKWTQFVKTISSWVYTDKT